jgi:hypothetical protein
MNRMSHKIPGYNNLYGTIFNVKSKKALADMFESKGWSVRNSSWTDFEVRTDWGELTIESEDKNPLINGTIDPMMFDQLKQILNSFNVVYSLELYDEQKNLIKEEKSNN